MKQNLNYESIIFYGDKKEERLDFFSESSALAKDHVEYIFDDVKNDGAVAIHWRKKGNINWKVVIDK